MAIASPERPMRAGRALFDPALASFPRPPAGQRLVLSYTACLEPSETCLFKGIGWEFVEE